MMLPPRLPRLLTASALTLALAAPARATAPDPCATARTVLGKAAAALTDPAACQAALDRDEEDRWQFWLDMAAANELVNAYAKAALAYNRFVTAADARGDRLPARFIPVRDDARAKLARLDLELLASYARVTFSSDPPGAELTYDSPNIAKPPDKTVTTPAAAYFPVGTHTVRAHDLTRDIFREYTFTASIGAPLQLKFDFRPGVPESLMVQESPGPALLGQAAPIAAAAPRLPDTPTPPATTPTPPPTTLVVTRPDNDPEGPPTHRPGPSIGTRVGSVAVATGAAALALGTVFALQASGLDDEAACSGAACDAQPRARARVRRDAETSWDRATASFITGGVLLGAGLAAILLWEDSDDAKIAPYATPDGGGVQGGFTF